jgi:hypothetical protein
LYAVELKARMANELERMLKELVIAYVKHYHLCLEEMRNHKNPSC